MALNPLLQAIETVCEEKKISKDVVLQTLEAALAAAYRKDYGQPNENIKVEFHPETGEMRVFDVKTVMEKPEEDELDNSDTNEPQQPSGPPNTTTVVMPDGSVGVDVADEKPRFHPRLHIIPEEARILKPGSQIGDEIRTELTVPSSFGRMAAQTAKQVIMQKLREAERNVMYDEFKSKEHTVVTGIVQRREGRVVLVDFGRLTGMMLPEGQAPHEQYHIGDRVKVYVESVELKARGPEVIISRTSPELVRYLFTVEIPEIQHNHIEIMGIAREAGSRVKVAVKSLESNIDPVGSCVGQRGARVQAVISELKGEKIDIIEWNESSEEYLRHALAPAKVSRLALDEEKKNATVYVADDQLSLAIGRNGQNVRLASKLTGWNVDIRKDETLTPTVEPTSVEATEGDSKNSETEEPTMEAEESKVEQAEESPKEEHATSNDSQISND